MFGTILAWVALTAGSAVIARAVLGRALGFHGPQKWRGGGEVTLAGELAFGAFLVCVGLSGLMHSAVWVVPAIAAWVVGYVAQWRAGRQFAAAEAELRARNAEQHPGVFDRAPPEDIDATFGDELDVYDAGACTYLGRAPKANLKALIDRFAEVSEGRNDLFLIVESLEMLDEGALSGEFRQFLTAAFADRDYLLLRWLPIREPVVAAANGG
jgi:hypothetical protein